MYEMMVYNGEDYQIRRCFKKILGTRGGKFVFQIIDKDNDYNVLKEYETLEEAQNALLIYKQMAGSE